MQLSGRWRVLAAKPCPRPARRLKTQKCNYSLPVEDRTCVACCTPLGAEPGPESSSPQELPVSAGGSSDGDVDGTTSQEEPALAALSHLLPDGMEFPSVRFQRPLSSKERKGYSADADDLAGRKKLMVSQIGAKGFTPTGLASCMRMLLAHGLMRIRLGDGSGVARLEARKFLEAVLDAQGVGELGHTITLYRQRGLPTPSNFPQLHGPPRAGGGRDGADGPTSQQQQEQQQQQEVQHQHLRRARTSKQRFSRGRELPAGGEALASDQGWADEGPGGQLGERTGRLPAPAQEAAPPAMTLL